MILVAVVAMGADLATFLWMTSRLTMAAEANPVIGLLTPAVAVLFKVVVAAAMIAVYRVIKTAREPYSWHKHPRMASAVLVVAILVGVIGATTNLRTVVINGA